MFDDFEILFIDEWQPLMYTIDNLDYYENAF